MRTIVIIPARIESSRLPGKPLKIINGGTIIWSCYSNALASVEADKVYVASNNINILIAITKELKGNIGAVIATSNKPVNGTERVAEAARLLQLEPDDIVVNLQGDMPFFDSEIIDNPVRLMKELPNCNVTSVMTALSEKDRDDLNKVKVAINRVGKATSFSREYQGVAYLHIGVYVFRNRFLQKYVSHGIVEKEKLAHLEQQRIMFMDEPVYMAYARREPVTINTEEDLEKARYV